MSTVTGNVGPHNIAESTLRLGSLIDLDYADQFTLTTRVASTGTATSEQWARAMFGDTPGPVGTLIFRGLLQLRIASAPAPDTIGGWRIADRGPDWIRLEAESWALSSNLVVQVGEGRLSLATFQHYRRRAGALVWTALSAVHRRLVPGLLRATASRVEAQYVRR
jgi:hypothetical protein